MGSLSEGDLAGRVVESEKTYLVWERYMSKDLFDLSGRVAIVTGASSGLGVTFAETLADAGADVVICARRLEKLEETGRKVRGLGAKCLVVKTDVTKPDEVDNLIDRTMETFGKIDILGQQRRRLLQGLQNCGRPGLRSGAEGDGGQPDQRRPLLSPGRTKDA